MFGVFAFLTLSAGAYIGGGMKPPLSGPLKLPVPRELSDYLAAKDGSYRWSVRTTPGASTEPKQDSTKASRTTDIDLVSQTWHGVEWHHTLAFTEPPIIHRRIGIDDTALLYITGGEPNAKDQAEADELSEASGMPVAMLYNIPVQPIEGRKEDDLIAHTFDEYLRTGDPTWPLLFPMTKSAIRAMDAVGVWSHGRIRRFVVLGQSKRGWTTWMTACSGDPRVIGIVPTAYDNLNIPAQMKHQQAIWGHLSPAIRDYTARNLQDKISSGRGARLAQIVDPYSYLPKVKARILIVDGANDPYWSPDALSLYSAALPASASFLKLPNEGHDFHDKGRYLRTVAAFARVCQLRARWPKIDASQRGGALAFRSDVVPSAVRTYVATADTPDFSNALWELAGVTTPSAKPPTTTGGKTSLMLSIPTPVARAQASFAIADYSILLAGGVTIKFSLSTPTFVVVSP